MKWIKDKGALYLHLENFQNSTQVVMKITFGDSQSVLPINHSVLFLCRFYSPHRGDNVSSSETFQAEAVVKEEGTEEESPNWVFGQALVFSLFRMRGLSVFFTIHKVEQQTSKNGPTHSSQYQKEQQGFLFSPISALLISQESSLSCLSFFESIRTHRCRMSFEITFGASGLAGPSSRVHQSYNYNFLS